MSAIPRPALRFYGGKFGIGEWVAEHFPRHDCYVEPYAGAGSVLLHKPPSPLEVLNDLDGEVVNFWRVLRDRTDELARAVDLTPFSREEYERSYHIPEDADPVERARLFVVRSWQGRAGPTGRWKAGWRYSRVVTNGAPAVKEWDRMDHLRGIAARIKQVQIERDDALETIKRFDSPESLFYCDPPYLWDVRSKWKRSAYKHEMSDDDHAALAGVLHSIRGMAIISGYPSELYDSLYEGWQTATRVARTENADTRVEVLWFSPAATARALQGRLFGSLRKSEEAEEILRGTECDA